MLPADGSSTCGGSTFVCGRIRSPHISDGRQWLSCRQPAYPQPRAAVCLWKLCQGTDRQIAVSLNAPLWRGHNNMLVNWAHIIFFTYCISRQNTAIGVSICLLISILVFNPTDIRSLHFAHEWVMTIACWKSRASSLSSIPECKKTRKTNYVTKLQWMWTNRRPLSPVCSDLSWVSELISAIWAIWVDAQPNWKIAMNGA